MFDIMNRIRQRGSPFPPWQTAFALEALRRAWLAVRGNKGRGGSDGQTLADFERNVEDNLGQLQSELLAGQYRPHRVTQVLAPKPGDAWRPLTLWAVRDRIAQRAVHDYLEPIFETRFLPCSYGFRPGRATRDAAMAIWQARQAGAYWALDADIKDCFGQMDSKRLQQQLARWQVPKPLRRLIDLWLQAKVWNAWIGSEKRAGASQGGVISPLLCNLYLHPFDKAMQRPGLWLVRYADDFVVLSRKKATIRQAERQAAGTLQRLGLEIHPHKTRITNFAEGFQFVGWFFTGNRLFELK